MSGAVVFSAYGGPEVLRVQAARVDAVAGGRGAVGVGADRRHRGHTTGKLVLIF
ncbi:hypothetical protein ACGFIJ_22675 [Microbispora bryophytorum]|uniref:hypothetical protein n=1 Tax=Microbispora bryophytorum TaxID=1460882 RepID=UPI003710F598